jgi:hypothetical protein
MSLFQHTILKKQIAAKAEKIGQAYKLYDGYFHNSTIQENIRNSKEEQFQEGFLRELFVKILGYMLSIIVSVNGVSHPQKIGKYSSTLANRAYYHNIK